LFGETAKTSNPKKAMIVDGVRRSEAKCGRVRRGFLGNAKKLRVLKGCACRFHLAKRYVGFSFYLVFCDRFLNGLVLWPFWFGMHCFLVFIFGKSITVTERDECG